jgi:hypothetical protein
MSKEKEKKPKGEFQLITFADKILSVYRRCSCGGDVQIKVDKKTGKSTALCLSCGNTLTWGGKE